MALRLFPEDILGNYRRYSMKKFCSNLRALETYQEKWRPKRRGEFTEKSIDRKHYRKYVNLDEAVVSQKSIAIIVVPKRLVRY